MSERDPALLTCADLTAAPAESRVPPEAYLLASIRALKSDASGAIDASRHLAIDYPAGRRAEVRA